jgi:SAM-dependent methyltransferase
VAGVGERGVVFGEAVDLYDAVRPGYPAALVDDVLAAAPPGPAVEVGAGTGKATVAFAARGLVVTCVEPDPRMAAALRRNVAGQPGVRVVVDTFERWRPDRPYALLYSAQAWHWVDERRRTALAAAALAPGGTLALFWNTFLLADPALHAALADVDARHGMDVEHMPHGRLATEHAPEISDDFAAEWPTLGLAGDDRFTDLRSRRYRRTLRWPTAQYVQLLTTTSHYRIVAPERRDAALADVAAAVDAHGGTMTVVADTDLALARRP